MQLVAEKRGYLGRIRFKTPVDYYDLMQPVGWMYFDKQKSTCSGFERKVPETIDNDSSLMMRAALPLAAPLVFRSQIDPAMLTTECILTDVLVLLFGHRNWRRGPQRLLSEIR